MTAWHCAACGEPVDLADARRHHARCSGIAAAIVHEPWCDGTASIRTDAGRLGDDRHVCTGCGRYTFTPRTVTTSSRWRCPRHVDEPVNARGKGCRECARERDGHAA